MRSRGVTGNDGAVTGPPELLCGQAAAGATKSRSSSDASLEPGGGMWVHIYNSFYTTPASPLLSPLSSPPSR